MIGEMALLSVLNAQEVVDGGHHDELPPLAVGGCEESPPSINREERHLEVGARGYRMLSRRCSPPGKTSMPLWPTNGRLTSLWTCRTVSRAA